MPATRIAHPTRQQARHLRATMTPQERTVWKRLRQMNRSEGRHFRRQAPIGLFIADFAEFSSKLVIEIDGGQHGGDRDQRRDAWLADQGFKVLRFWNSDIRENLDDVIQAIRDAAAPPPHPSPTRGEGAAGSNVAQDLPASGATSEPCATCPPPPCGEGLGVGPATDEEDPT